MIRLFKNALVSSKLEELISTRDGAKNNFDLIRLVAAILVLVSHAFPLSGNSYEPLIHWTGGQASFGDLAVCVFFFISGFLVTRSLERSRSLLTFTVSRVLRIFPGLAIAVLFAALILGPLVTSKDLSEYWRDPLFSNYFKNIFLDMNYFLPGVFAENASPAVNGSLWTLEIEFIMYAALPVVFGLMLLLGRWIFLIGLLILIYLFHFVLTGPADDGVATYYLIYLGQYFAAGAIAYSYRDQIPMNNLLGLACLILVLGSAIWGGFGLTRLFAGSYVLLWLAYMIPKIRDPITPRGDLSYGVYIYAFPVQQLVAEQVNSGAAWLVNIALALPLTMLLAMLSWRFVEAPSLKSRKPLIIALNNILLGHAWRTWLFSRIKSPPIQ